MSGTTWEKATERAFIAIDETAHGIVITWKGTVMGPECSAYLPELGRRLQAYLRPVKLIYDLRELKSFDKENLLQHAAFSKEKVDQISKIAVVTESAAHIAGITAVNLLQRRPLKSFSTLSDALEW